MARERESSTTRSRTRDRDDAEPETQSRTRTRGNDRDTTSTRKSKSSSKSVAINLDTTTFETFGLWDNKEVEVLGAYFAPWNYGGNLKKKDGTPFHTLGFFVEYRDLESGEEHTEPVAAGDLNFYAPGLSPNEEDYAGGSAEDFRKLASGEYTESDVDIDSMRGPYLLPVSQGYDDDGAPSYKRSNAARGTNMDFYLQQLAVCAKDAGVELSFNPDDPHNIDKYVTGIEGHVDRMSNSLRKGGGNDDFGGAKSKPLVFTEIFEKKSVGSGSGGSDRKGSRARETAKDESDEKPTTSTRRGRAAASEPELDKDEEVAKPAARRGSRKSSEPTKEFLDLFENEVESFLSEQPKKSCRRTRMTDIVERFDRDTPEERWALELVTDEKYIDTFWKRDKGEGNFDYNEETDTASL